MASEIRVNKINNRAGLGTITIADTGVVVNGIVTCTEVSGLNVLNIAGVSTFASTLDINGDIDVDGHTNLDNLSVAGVTTFSNKIQVGSGVTIESNQVATGQATFTGIVTASAFKLSDGSNVGGVESDAQSNTIGGTDAGINLDSDTYSNTFFGHSSGKQINSGDGNTALGQYSLQNGTSATGNSVLGYSAGRAITSGNHNTLLGYEAGTSMTDKNNCIFIGQEAGKTSNVHESIGIGKQALMSLTGTGYQNIAIGNMAGQQIQQGQYNVLIGTGSGNAVVQNDNNTALGYYTLSSNSSGNNNTAVGWKAGNTGTNNITSGSNNLLLGYNAAASSSSVSNEITLGDANIDNFRIPGIGVSFGSSGEGYFSGIVTATNFVKADGSNVGGVESDAQENTVGGTNAGDSFNGTNATKNTVFGYDAGTAITDGDKNSFFGHKAGEKTTTGFWNVFVGEQAGRDNLGAYGNIAIGRMALLQNTGSNYSVAIGNGALINCSGEGNIGIGFDAGQNISGTQRNTVVGAQAGDSGNTLGGNCMLLGARSEVSASNVANEITLGDSDVSHLRIPGIGVSFGRSGATIAGVVTATSFSGDGSSLSNLPASAPVGGASTNTVFFENDTAVAVNYQVTSGKNAMSAGPIAINAGIAVTVPSGSSWTIV